MYNCFTKQSSVVPDQFFVFLCGKHCQATFVVKWGHCELFSGGVKASTEKGGEEKCGLFINELRE